MIVVVIVVIVKIDSLLIVLPGLDLAPVAFFAEGKVEIVALDAHPILGAIIGGLLGDLRAFAMRCFSAHCHFLFDYFEYIESY